MKEKTDSVSDLHLKQFSTLWHTLLMLDKNKELQEKYPNFICLSQNEICILCMVADNPQIVLKDICQALLLPKSTLTNIINRLEKKGYLHRELTKKDLRSFALVLTEKGQQAQKEHKAYEAFCFGKILSTLDDTEQEQLLNLMGKMCTALFPS